MQIPPNLSTPHIKLGYGEEIIQTFGTLRRKGILGSRYGALYLTTERVAFVRAHAAVGEQTSQWGAKPSVAFERSAIKSITKVPARKQFALEITDGRRTERFIVDECEADRLIALLSNLRAAS